MSILDYGATIQSVMMKGKDGKFEVFCGLSRVIC